MAIATVMIGKEDISAWQPMRSLVLIRSARYRIPVSARGTEAVPVRA